MKVNTACDDDFRAIARDRGKSVATPRLLAASGYVQMRVVKSRAVLLVAVLCLFGAQMLGLHAHFLAPAAAQTAAVHLATAAEDADADHAVAVDVIGQWLADGGLLALPAWAASGLFVLLAMLCALAAPRLPRAPDALGDPHGRPYLLRPPSQAPPY